MEKRIMNNKQYSLHRWFISLSVLVIFVGLLAAVLLWKQSRISTYPLMIADAYRDVQHHLTVPGFQEVSLTRTGAYGIYFEHNLIRSIPPEVEIPPAIDCKLISTATGSVIKAVPDYVETNRYRSRDLQASVLIMSVTVDTPGTYTFVCNYQDGRVEPEIVVALGPNYFWEFIRVAWKIALPALGGSTILCGCVLLALLLLVTGIVIKMLNATKLKTQK